MATNKQLYIKRKYEESSMDIQNLLVSDELVSVISSIGKMHSLTMSQIEQLVDEVGLILIGIVPAKYLKVGVQDRLEIDGEKAKNISREIEKRVFYQVKDSLEEMQNNTPAFEVKILNTEPPKTQTTQTKKMSLAELLPKKETLTAPTPPVSTPKIQPSKLTAPQKKETPRIIKSFSPDIPPPPHPPKPIVGAEKIGIDIPTNSRERASLELQNKGVAPIKRTPPKKQGEGHPSTEHLFEKKLREASQSPAQQEQKTENVAGDDSTDTAPAEIHIKQKKVDPYREFAK